MGMMLQNLVSSKIRIPKKDKNSPPPHPPHSIMIRPKYWALRELIPSGLNLGNSYSNQ
jgi:hypothetical protein